MGRGREERRNVAAVALSRIYSSGGVRGEKSELGGQWGAVGRAEPWRLFTSREMD